MIWQYARADLGRGRVRELSLPEGLWKCFRRPGVHGWYGRLAGQLVGLTVVNGSIVLLSPSGSLQVTEETRAVLVRGPAANTLAILGGEGPDWTVTYAPPKLPFVARIDPTYDETEEDGDFGLWLANVLAAPERRELLRENFGSQTGFRV